jgi:hypothetical protein
MKKGQQFVRKRTISARFRCDLNSGDTSYRAIIMEDND